MKLRKRFTLSEYQKGNIRITLTKEVSDLNTENYRALLKEIKEYLNKWNDVPCEWNGSLNTIKMAIFAKLISAIPFKIPVRRHGRAESKIHTEMQGILDSQKNP